MPSLEDLGMRTCDNCRAMAPLEAVLCPSCDHYLGRMQAVMGAGVTSVPPAATPPAPRHPHDRVDWGVMSDPEPALAIAQLDWKQTRTGRYLGRMEHGGVEYRLVVGRNGWRVDEMRLFRGVVIPVMLETGPHASQQEGIQLAQACLERCIRKALLRTEPETGTAP